MIAAILAAGRGTRMYPFSTRFPKPILPICNKPLLQHQIEMMRDLGIREILLVIGHLGHEIAGALGDGSDLGVQIKYVEQTETLGIANALGQLEPHVHEPTFLLLGDIDHPHAAFRQQLANRVGAHGHANRRFRGGSRSGECAG